MNEQNEQEVYEQYETIRREGQVNMMDRIGVADIAVMKGFDELADVAANRSDYVELLRRYSELKAKYETTRSQ